jgi:UDP-glucuronate decarboxylase
MKKTAVKHQIEKDKHLTQVLVAGGAGFIGSFLCQLLLDQNCFVYCLDNFKTGSKENINSFIDKKNFKFIEYDIKNSLTKLKLANLDYIFHLAGLENHLDKEKISLQTLLTNSEGTKNLLELAKSKKSKFLLGSSLAVFDGLISSDELKNYFGAKENGQSYYSLAEAKRFSESLVFEYFKNYSLNCRIVRILDVYGPRMSLDSQTGIAGLFKNITEKTPLTIAGDGTKVLYPTYISDLVYGLLKAMFNQQTAGKIYTLANSSSLAYLDFAHKLKQQSQNQNDLVFTAQLQTSFTVSKEDILKTQEDLNWQPEIDIDAGIKKTLEWINIISPAGSETKKQEDIEEVEVLKKPLDEKIAAVKLKEELKIKDKKTKVVKGGAFVKKVKLFSKKKKTYSDKKEDLKNSRHKQRESIKSDPKRQKLLIKLIQKTSLKKRIIFKIFIIFFLVSFLILSLPVFLFSRNLKKGFDFLEAEEYEKASLSWNQSKKILLGFSDVSSLLFSKASQETLTYLDLGISFIQAKKQESLARQHLYNLLDIIVKGERGDVVLEIKEANIYLDKIYQNLSLMESELSKIDLEQESPFYLKEIKSKIDSYKDQVSEAREKVKLARELLTVLPEMTAFKDRKTYLVLIQDNLELRPTGGFISAYGLLTFEKGKLLDFEIKNIAKADSGLKGRITPPKPLEKYLNLDAWYLRDSNWSPDFTSAAYQSQWFLEKEMGIKTDGTIALNLYVLKDILKNIGPVQLLNYNETITATNLFDKTIQYFEVDFSSGNKDIDFLTQLCQLSFEKIKQLEKNDWFLLFDSLTQSLEQKQFLLSFENDKLSSFMAEKNWSGALRKQADNLNKNTVGDYLMINEANLGVNKANFYLKRSLEQEVTILETGDFLESLTITYKNQSTSKGWPAGDYRNYLRIYVPANSNFLSLKAGSSLSDLNEVNTDLITTSQVLGKQEIGFLVEVPVQETRFIKLIYKTPYQLKFDKRQATYLFYLQKQPGWGEDPVQFKLNLAEGINPIRIAPKAQINGSQLNFTSTSKKDNFYVIDFIK